MVRCCIPAIGSSILNRCWASPRTWPRLRRLGDGGVLAMVCDSTNVFVEGTSGSEADVRDSLMEVVGRLEEPRRGRLLCQQPGPRRNHRPAWPRHMAGIAR